MKELFSFNVRLLIKKILILIFINTAALTYSGAVFSASPPGAPKTKYWVTDQANVLSSATESQLTQNAIKHEKQTGNQVVVVTVKSLDGWSIEQYGLWLGNNWGVGQKNKNNGVVFLVAPNERKVRIEVGAGLSSVIPNSLAKTIIDHEIIPNFKDAHLEKGVIKGHQAIIEALGGEYNDKSWWDNVLVYILLPFFLLARLFGFGGGRFSGGGGSFDGGGASGDW